VEIACVRWPGLPGRNPLAPRMRAALGVGSLYEWRVIRPERGPTLPRSLLGHQYESGTLKRECMEPLSRPQHPGAQTSIEFLAESD